MTQQQPEALKAFPQKELLKAHTFFDDFDFYDANQWKETVVDGGTDAAQVTAIAAGDGGLLELTPNNAAGDNILLQLGDGTNGKFTFALAADRRAWQLARIKVDVAAEALPIVGMSTVIADPWAALANDFIGFVPSSDDLLFVVRRGGTTSSNNVVATLESDTFVDLAWYYDGNDSVYVYVDDVLIETVDVTSSAEADLLPTGNLSPTFGVECTTTDAHSMFVDYLLCSKYRL